MLNSTVSIYFRRAPIDGLFCILQRRAVLQIQNVRRGLYYLFSNCIHSGIYKLFLPLSEYFRLSCIYEEAGKLIARIVRLARSTPIPIYI
jgi:hypothetical protein